MCTRCKSFFSQECQTSFSFCVFTEEKVVFCKMTDLQLSVYRALLDSDDLQQLVLRQHEICDCGSDSKRGQCCYQVILYWHIQKCSSVLIILGHNGDGLGTGKRCISKKYFRFRDSYRTKMLMILKPGEPGVIWFHVFKLSKFEIDTNIYFSWSDVIFLNGNFIHWGVIISFIPHNRPCN